MTSTFVRWVDLKRISQVVTISLLLLIQLMAQSEVDKLNKEEIAITIDSINRKDRFPCSH